MQYSNRSIEQLAIARDYCNVDLMPFYTIDRSIDLSNQPSNEPTNNLYKNIFFSSWSLFLIIIIIIIKAAKQPLIVRLFFCVSWSIYSLFNIIQPNVETWLFPCNHMCIYRFSCAAFARIHFFFQLEIFSLNLSLSSIWIICLECD